ncbi:MULTISPECIES: hypothetical protein [unclassified Bradyrhizobium]|nr:MULTISPECIES: hypothetical protein [unclassified Bradyrhizobium]
MLQVEDINEDKVTLVSQRGSDDHLAQDCQAQREVRRIAINSN